MHSHALYDAIDSELSGDEGTKLGANAKRDYKNVY